MNVCKVPDMCKDMEYKYITEDSKTRVYVDAGTRVQEVTAWSRWKTREKVNPSPL